LPRAAAARWFDPGHRARADAFASNSNLVALTQAEKWNGPLPAIMVPGSAVPT